MELNINEIRSQFPILHQEIKGKKLVYFDNAATTQKPRVVIDALQSYYEGYNANIHRGIHYLAEKATAAFEETRKSVQNFLNAKFLPMEPPTVSIWWPIHLVKNLLKKATKLLSVHWSIIAILSPGKCSVRKKVVCLK